EQVLATLRKVAPYILVGVGVGAVIHNVILQEWIERILGSGNPFSVILATLVGIPLYADIFGTIPVAESLFAKGAGLGTVLSFMMAVTALSLPSMMMLRKAVRPKLLAVFVGIVATGIILVGYFFNAFAFLLL
ncbi:MAG: permease, partial [Oscillospiraceae bacterium]